MSPQNMADLELKYHDITELFELADALVDTAESEFITNPDEQLALVEPLVEAVGDAADVLTEEFLTVASQTKANNAVRRSKIEGALRKIYVAIDAYKQQTAKSKQALMNIADPIVEKIKRQVEVIVAIFVDYVDLTLDRIMQKTHIDELKKRQEKIAIMLHALSQERGLDPA
ncbi:MAG: hypothetical protein K2Q12_07895 [Rickettsiales bacterium]|nr:hypothetical protein [Rickettsiales bacterium]